jgi:hypothetical protein
VRLEAGDDVLLDLLGVRAGRHVEQRPLLLHQQLGDPVADDLEHLALEPGEELLVAGPPQTHQAEDELLRLRHLHREVPVHHRADAEAGLGVADVADGPAELHPRELAHADEVDLRDEEVPAGGRLHQSSDERDVLGLQRVAPRPEPPLHLAVLDEDGDLVRADGELGHHPDVPLRIGIDDVVLRGVGAGDEVALRLTLQCIEQTQGEPPGGDLRR